jgi:hypothetical protein
VSSDASANALTPEPMPQWLELLESLAAPGADGVLPAAGSTTWQERFP